MSPDPLTARVALTERAPTITGAEIVAELVPPRQFDGASLENYVPDAAFPSQAEAVEAVAGFGGAAERPARRGLFRRRADSPDVLPGLYLDGGFGVGKTHLLAALFNRTTGRRYFGTFIEYTALVGAVGYAGAARQLEGASLVCIDEFELDDPGDTMMMTRLLGDLAEGGTRIAATSNTPPAALGEGRFAAADFLREIQGLSDRFRTLRIDGDDYRRREVEAKAHTVDDLDAAVASLPGTVSVDDFAAVVAHLSSVHPSRYVKLIDGLDGVALRDVRPFTSQTDALRFVAFVDRLYDAQVRVLASGAPLDTVFSDEMLAGGYRKKYLRATSRLVALTSAH
ncbi:cell division protein ZapE [Frigoribacterium sp. CFBP 13707]|uniref:cell division protein ZapE n=1 Tax=Frigoribacterium sp. CFBP 13707 TaxID=2775313 RepID=UPI0017828B4B|nr:cell division protein ZapE [Frigoribacterium sp. CFBP 13707]MBD8728041.1 cell division protein ZapE [Frigoribacterium sp. CFBP 13707]